MQKTNNRTPPRKADRSVLSAILFPEFKGEPLRRCFIFHSSAFSRTVCWPSFLGLDSALDAFETGGFFSSSGV
jgi:hypothetical protein